MKCERLHLDGAYTYNAAAAATPGDIVVRPCGTLAHFDGMQDAAIGDAISPKPLKGTGIVAKKSTDTFAAAAAVYWDATNKEATSTSSGNKRMGSAIAAAGSGVTTMHINFEG